MTDSGMIHLFPVPRPVRLGDRTFLIAPATIRDLHELEAATGSDAAAVAEAALDALFDPSLPDAEKDRLCFDALIRLDGDTPPGGGDAPPRGTDVEWAAAVLAAALRKSDPGLTTEDIADVASGITPRQFAALTRAFYDGDVKRPLILRIFRDVPETPAGGRPLWWPAVMATLVKDFGLTPAEVGDLTPKQALALVSGGKKAESDFSPNTLAMPLAEVEKIRAGRYAAAYGLSPEPPAPPPEPVRPVDPYASWNKPETKPAAE